VHYDGSDQGLAKADHKKCIFYWKATRRFHMGAARGWKDIGYSFGVCPHGYVFEGRGWTYTQAAQPGGNQTWTSVTFMSGKHETPTDAQVEAFQALRDCLRGKGLQAAITKHMIFISTDCPGSILSGMVNSKALLRVLNPDKPAPKPELKEDPVRYYGQLNNGPGAVTPISLHPGDVGSIGFITDNGIASLPPVQIRVAMHDTKGWYAKEVELDSKKAKVWFNFRDPKTTDGISVVRLDDNDIPVAWDAS
jgi:hypothetical protein